MWEQRSFIHHSRGATKGCSPTIYIHGALFLRCRQKQQTGSKGQKTARSSTKYNNKSSSSRTAVRRHTTKGTHSRSLPQLWPCSFPCTDPPVGATRVRQAVAAYSASQEEGPGPREKDTQRHAQHRGAQAGAETDAIEKTQQQHTTHPPRHTKLTT